jgi:hypothetical protein
MTVFCARVLETAGGFVSASVAWRQTCSARPKCAAEVYGLGRAGVNAGDGTNVSFPDTQITTVTGAIGTASSTQRLASSK